MKRTHLPPSQQQQQQQPPQPQQLLQPTLQNPTSFGQHIIPQQLQQQQQQQPNMFPRESPNFTAQQSLPRQATATSVIPGQGQVNSNYTIGHDQQSILAQQHQLQDYYMPSIQQQQQQQQQQQPQQPRHKSPHYPQQQQQQQHQQQPGLQSQERQTTPGKQKSTSHYGQRYHPIPMYPSPASSTTTPVLSNASLSPLTTGSNGGVTHDTSPIISLPSSIIGDMSGMVATSAAVSAAAASLAAAATGRNQSASPLMNNNNGGEDLTPNWSPLPYTSVSPSSTASMPTYLDQYE
ncbi:hypothetical protein BGZ83_009268, partial [Gryganskiella cystojenkinii]